MPRPSVCRSSSSRSFRSWPETTMHLPRIGRDADLGRLGVSVGARVGGVEQAHHVQVQLARLQCPAEQLVGGGTLLGEEVEGLVERGIHVRVFVAEDVGMIGVGGGALQAVEDQLLQAGQRRRPAAILPFRQRHILRPAGSGRPNRRPASTGRGPVERLRLSCRPWRRRPRRAIWPGRGRRPPRQDGRASRCGVEIDVGDRGERGIEDGLVHCRGRVAPSGRGPMGVHRNRPWSRRPAGLAARRWRGLSRRPQDLVQAVPLAVCSH